MRIFSTRQEPATVGVLTARVRAAEDPLETVIEAGVLETAVLDALQPHLDGPSPVRDALRRVSLAAARLRFSGDRRALLAALDALPVPPDLAVVARTPEGFAFYALHPAQYERAARLLASERDRGPVTVVGLRSAGTSLSAVVHVVIERLGFAVRSVAIRPRGPPWDRRPVLDPALAAALAGPGEVWIVDEGPGLSGTSLTGTADAVAALGVPDAAVTLLCQWVPDGTRFVSEAARARWPRWRKVAVPVDAVAPLDGEVLDAGAWRAALPPEHWPPVHPWHERRKRRQGDRVVRFAGLGRTGRAVRARAEALAEAGLGPRVHGLRDGHLVLDWVPGVPLTAPHPDLLDAAARHVAFRARHLALDAPPDLDALVSWVVEAVAGTLGVAVDPDALRRHATDDPAVQVDGRMLLHEWVLGPSGPVKVDAVDHCDDHFLPGCQQAAWDVAALAAEVDPGLAEAVAARTGIRPTPLHHVAWRAWRLAYATLAPTGLLPDEAGRWARVRVRYEVLLREALAWLG